MALSDVTIRDIKSADNRRLISTTTILLGELQRRFAAENGDDTPAGEPVEPTLDEYNLMLDEVYGNTVIAGAHYPTSKAFARVDPRSYHNGYLQYANLIAAYTANR